MAQHTVSVEIDVEELQTVFDALGILGDNYRLAGTGFMEQMLAAHHLRSRINDQLDYLARQAR